MNLLSRAVCVASFLTAAALAFAAEAPPEPRALPVVAPLDLTWWRGLGDERFAQLLASGEGAAPAIRAAAARLGQAEAALGGVRAGSKPSLDLNGKAARRAYSRRERRENPNLSSPATELNAGATLGYEVDLWGRQARERKAAAGELAAARAEVVAAQLAFVAELGETWFALRANRSLADLLAARRERAVGALALQQARREAGRATRDDTAGATELIAELDREAAELAAERARLRPRLAVLLGESAGDAHSFAEVPPLDDLTALLPDLAAIPLDQRPEVAAASACLQAARERVGVARAAARPTLRLLATGELTGETLRRLLSDGSLSGFLAAEVAAPLFDGGRNRARVDSARADLTAAGEAYAVAILGAVADSAGTLERFAAARDRLGAASRVARARREAAERAELRRAAGRVGRLETLLEDERWIAAEADLVRSRLELRQAQLAVARVHALGVSAF